MRRDIVPKSVPRFLIDVNQLFDFENIVGDVVNQIAGRLFIGIVIDRDQHIVRFPAPVFFPLQLIALECAVAHSGKRIVYAVNVLAVDIHAFNHTADLVVLGQLRILMV